MNARRSLARLPVWLYRAHLGWLLGHRFLLLTHRGRRTGLSRETVLEVVHYDGTADAYIVASGWGEHADWVRNVEADPRVTITVGRRRLAATAARLGIAQAGAVLLIYASAHPFAFGVLTGILAKRRVRATASDCRALAQVVPLFALRVRSPPSAGEGITASRRILALRRLRPRWRCSVGGAREAFSSSAPSRR